MSSRNQKKCQSCNVAMIVDLYEDRHKSRLIFPFVMLVLFMYVVFTLLASSPVVLLLPRKLECLRQSQ